MTTATDPEKFPALFFDAEARPSFLDTKVGSLWMLIPAGGMVIMIGWWVLVGGVSPVSVKVWATLALDIVWLVLFQTTRRALSRDWSRYLRVLPDAIDVHVPRWYEAVIPFDAIDRIEARSRYTLGDRISEMFSLYGPVPERRQHVAIYCTRRIAARVPFLRFNHRTVFRAKLQDPERFVSTANDRLFQWRQAHRPRLGA